MNAAAIVVSALFALGMMGVALAVLVRGAHETSNTPRSWPAWPPTRLS
jgi:hypothetical protein